MSAELAPKRAYLEDGRLVEVVEKIGERYVVSPVLECYVEGFPVESTGEEIVVDRIFDKAPTQRFDKAIEELNEKIYELHNKIADKRNELRELKETEKENDELFKKYDQLKHLKTFLTEGVDCYVVEGWSEYKIVDFKDTKGEYSRDAFRLLSLFGNTNGDLEWRLNRYCDGSGSSETVYPCISHEHAVNVITDIVTSAAEKEERSGSLSRIISAADKYGIAIPDKARIRHKEHRIKEAETAFLRRKAEFEMTEKALKEARSL